MLSKENRHTQYRHSIQGLLSCAHRNMRRRVSGEQPKWYSYLGLEILPREDFLEWAKKDKTFKKLYNEWVHANYEYKYTPSVDRLNPTYGYTLDNINFCTIQQNSIRRWQMNRSR